MPNTFPRSCGGKVTWMIARICGTISPAIAPSKNRGPAGFGKTALLADWTRRGKRPVAWVSLDAGDNDPARFWRHVVAALDRACPGIGERAGPLLGPPAPSSFEGLVSALINELAAQPGDPELPLVLDDIT
jgi:LuxR family transcriptional regulator, maltose regulon positive regulatory protein